MPPAAAASGPSAANPTATPQSRALSRPAAATAVASSSLSSKPPFDLKRWQESVKGVNIYAAAAIEEEKQPSLADLGVWKDFVDKRGRYRFGQTWPYGISGAAADGNCEERLCACCERGACFYSPSPEVVKQIEFCAKPSSRTTDNPRCIPCQASNRPCNVVKVHPASFTPAAAAVPKSRRLKSKNLYLDRLRELNVLQSNRRSSLSTGSNSSSSDSNSISGDPTRLAGKTITTTTTTTKGRPIKRYFEAETRLVDNSAISADSLHRVDNMAEALLRMDAVEHESTRMDAIQDLELFLQQAHFRIAQPHLYEHELSTLHHPKLRQFAYTFMSSPAAPLAIQRVLVLWSIYLNTDVLHAVQVSTHKKNQLRNQLTSIHSQLTNSYVLVRGSRVEFHRVQPVSSNIQHDDSFSSSDNHNQDEGDNGESSNLDHVDEPDGLGDGVEQETEQAC